MTPSPQMHILRLRLEAQLPSQTLLDAACGKQLVILPCYDADVPTSCHCDLDSSRWYKMQLGCAKNLNCILAHTHGICKSCVRGKAELAPREPSAASCTARAPYSSKESLASWKLQQNIHVASLVSFCNKETPCRVTWCDMSLWPCTGWQRDGVQCRRSACSREAAEGSPGLPHCSPQNTAPDLPGQLPPPPPHPPFPTPTPWKEPTEYIFAHCCDRLGVLLVTTASALMQVFLRSAAC